MTLPVNIRIVDGKPAWIGGGDARYAMNLVIDFPKWENFDISIVKEENVAASSAYLDKDNPPPDIRILVLDPLTLQEEFIGYGSMSPKKALKKALKILNAIHADDFVPASKQISIWKRADPLPDDMGCTKAMKRVARELEKLHRKEGMKLGKSFEHRLAKTLNYFAHGEFTVKEHNRICG